MAELAKKPDGVSMFGNDFDRLLLEVEFQTEDRLRVKLSPIGVERYEVRILGLWQI